MADRFPGHITLGGTIVIETIEQREAVNTLLAQFSQDTGHAWGESSWHETITTGNYQKFLDKLGYLEGFDDQATYGMFEEIEDDCRAVGIGYSRHSSARYEYNAEIIEWRPGMEAPFAQISDEDGVINVPGLTVETAVILIGEGRTDEVVEMLKQALGKHIPALEPLKIIDNAPKENENG